MAEPGFFLQGTDLFPVRFVHCETPCRILHKQRCAEWANAASYGGPRLCFGLRIAFACKAKPGVPRLRPAKARYKLLYA